jgi:type IV secretion system protein TrbJ
MQRQPMNKSAILAGVLAALLLVLVQPARAIFSFGDIVFDPSSYATLGKIFTSDATLLQKTILTYNETVKIYTNALQSYNLAMAMSQHFSHPQKAAWMTVAQTAANDYTRNAYGETVMWPQMINGRPALAPTAWANATLPVTHRSYLSGEVPGSSALLAHLASIEAEDGSSTKCLSTIAQYRANAALKATAAANLQTAQTDDTTATNSSVEQANLLNASQAQANNELRAQGTMQTCLVEQQILANKAQRDALADHLSLLGQTHDYYAGANSSTWADPTTKLSTYVVP